MRLKTEEEARQSWCPMLKSRSGPPDTNGRYTPDEQSLCIASQCMAWRKQHDERGYCGLAGKPTGYN